ncbi:MAG: hypothetical protein Q8P23_04385 [bacterium]|nr:hypothetical protein [bacterium]
MKQFISSIVALVLSAVLVVPMAHAVTGDKGFYYGTEAEQHDLNKVLARLVVNSLLKDHNGNARLSESNCGEKGGCGTPRLLVDSFRQMEGLPPVDLSNLVEFLESLEADENRGGYYDVTSLRPNPKAPSGFRAVMDGVQRGFNLGEKAWVYRDKKNNRKIVVLMGHCANPVYRLIPILIIGGEKPCPEIRFFARKGDTVVRHAAMGSPEFKDDRCSFAIKKVGETVFHILWRDACASEHCTFAANEAHLGKKAWMIASYELEEGEYVVRVPTTFVETNSPYVMAFCIERTAIAWPELPSGQYTMAQVDRYTEERGQWIAGHSDVVYVWWNAYRLGTDGVPRATIYHSEAEVPSIETVKMYWRYGVWEREQRASQAR